MRPLLVLCALPLAAVAGCAHSSPSPGPSEAVLPLHRVRLYETGIGYFERTGTLGGARGLGLPVPASHLDDALKTLVVLGSGGKPSVEAVEFPTGMTEGMARTLAGLPSSGARVGMPELLASLKGARVEVEVADDRLTGRIVDVVAPEHADDEDAKPSSLAIILLTEASELRQLAVAEIRSVRPSEPAEVARLHGALDSMSGKARGQRLMQILGSSAGAVTLGYVTEAPLWRVTYRLVLDSTGKGGVLQAWALLHNDTDEDWSGVRVELVNGRPTSFLYPLAAPRYGRRELAHPEQEYSTVPQLLGKTADGLWGDFDQEGAGSSYGYGSATSVNLGVGGLGTTGHGGGGGGIEVQSSEAFVVGSLAETSQATGTESGALFTYALPAPLALTRRSSALVPFLQRAVEVEAITFFTGPGEPACSGVRLVNDTGQTLPAGTLAAYADGGLAGEGGLERLKPSQRQFLRYGADPDVTLQVKAGSVHVREEPRRFTYLDDKLQEHFLRVTEEVFVLENRGGQPRTVYVGLPVVSNAKVSGADQLDYEQEASRAMAVFRLAPGQKIERAMKLEEGLSKPVTVADLRPETLQQLAALGEMSENERRALAEAVAIQKRVTETNHSLGKVNAEIKKTGKDLERLRAHLEAASGKSAGQSSGGAFVQRILTAEDRLETLQKKAEELEAAGEEHRRAIRETLKGLSR